MYAYNYQLLIKHILESGVKYAPNQEIVYRDLHRYKYKDMYERVKKLANVLESLGVKEGTKVAVLDWDSHRYLECYYAIPMVGAVLHTVNVRLSPEDILYTMQHAEDEVVFVFKDFLPLIETIKDKLDTVKHYVVMTDDGMPETSLTDMEYESLLKDADSNYDFPDFDENTMATMAYTTGTTGRPKGVWFTHRQLVLHTLAVAVSVLGRSSAIRLSDREVYMPLTPMFHVHAWGIPYVSTMLGYKQVYPGRYEPQMIAKLIFSERVTFSHCVPTILQMIVDNLPEGVKFNNWKVVLGGSKLTKGLALRAREKGIITMAGYGMSETCPVLTLGFLRPEVRDLSEEEQIEYMIKTGFPIPLVYIRVVNENMEDVKNDGKEMGEIVARAPWLTQSYLKNEEKTKELWEGGWLHTGDIAVVDELGYITIVDRLKDVVKSGGEWISTLTLENLLSMHPKVREVAVIGIPDEKWGERPLAIITPMGEKPTPEELKEFLMKFVEEGKITKWAVPDRYEFVDEIPKTSVGKIDKKVLKQRYS
ncbi:Acyl-CoA synthetases (AMP-forming)/AMP-acid ligases II [Archaeoglobus sulfaticallidus PM70-1]|uniref:Acyl-CoA synthetases (AMP-forming)/AMP-acid ligases II n=1 Tax=Archaeoglobus sulfaticallidus PM70-1 TaxID=387631 RepID=N0BF50_9EURY|nr:fatty acid--CoA ligase [Archaeoglobus sulfaticallidus]AGK61648.1 Acyl-CoA synthetases (AMP-forming)/AMP-acid ligases II [Archaeoglobus sulfaticallidus PM70-1]